MLVAVCAGALRPSHLCGATAVPLSTSARVPGGLFNFCNRFPFDTACLGDGWSIRRSSEYLVVSAFGLVFEISAHGGCTFAWLRIEFLQGCGLAAVDLQTGWLRLSLSPLALSGLAGATRTVCPLWIWISTPSVSAPCFGAVVHLVARDQLRSGRLHHARSALSACHVFIRCKRDCT
jgi:hypothetical protein